MFPIDCSKTTTIHVLNFSPWKRSVVRQCFPNKRIKFINNPSIVPTDGVLAIWGMKSVRDSVAPGIRILRIEDGFLRSVGLGADLIRPMSWVVDGCGMYYDATRPSDLEHLLAETLFTPEMLLRAAALRQRIVAEGITKYNVGVSGWQRPKGTEKIILVPGQVESDASLAYGAPEIRSNIDLLQAVRHNNPEAHIIYKPHPDVTAGLRAKGAGEDESLRWCDEQLVDIDMSSLLDAVDAVHVLTSLAGFEALLRGKFVTCYGQPFYSGWGLTHDIVENPRRTRRLTIDGLVAGVLIMYPLYLSRTSDALITPERALDELLLWRSQEGGAVPWWRQCFRMILRLVVGTR
jgi:capsular polysaccharide export protein